MSIYAELIKLRRVNTNLILELSLKFIPVLAIHSYSYSIISNSTAIDCFFSFRTLRVSRQVFHEITLEINRHRGFLETKINDRYLTLWLRVATFLFLTARRGIAQMISLT